MPGDDLTVTVEFTEGEPDKWTVNVVPVLVGGGTIDPATQGDAQFVDGVLAKLGYSVVAVEGEHLTIQAEAQRGYKIVKVEGTPGVLDSALSQSGTMIVKRIEFNQPAVDGGIVYVYFAASDPLEGEATLHVHDVRTGGEKDGQAQLRDTVTGTSTQVLGDGESETIVSRDGNELRVDVYHYDSSTMKVTEVITDADGNKLTAGVDYRWETDGTGTYIVVDMRVPELDIDITFADGPDKELKATLRYEEGSVEINKSGDTANVVTGDGSALRPLYKTDKVDVKITAPSGKVPVLTVSGDATGAVYVYAPDPMTEVGGEYRTSFTMQNEDVTVKVVYTEEPAEDERTAQLNVAGPMNSGSAEMHDGTGAYTTPKTVDFTNQPGVMNVKLGDKLTVEATPAAGYKVWKVEVNGGAILAKQTGATTYEVEVPASMAEGAQVKVVVWFEETKTDLRIDLVKTDVDNRPGNVTWLESTSGTTDKTDGSQPAGKQDIGMTGLTATDLVKVHVEVETGYKATLTVIGEGIEEEYKAPVGGVYELYMPNRNTVVSVKYEKDDKVYYDITLDVVPETPDSTYDAGNRASIDPGSAV